MELVPVAAFLLGIAMGAGFGPFAGIAAGAVVTLLYGATLGTTAEDVLKFADTDLTTTVVLFVILGGGALVGWAARSLLDDSS